MPLKPKKILHLLLIFLATFTASSFALSNDIKTLSNIAYGEFDDQVLDVYSPLANTKDAPVIFMVHGGAWRMGDKAARSVVKNKVDYWVSKGFVFVSVNYRMLPDIYPVEQADDVTTALIFAQQQAQQWGGSSEKFILMGHSAGAHLVSLVSVRGNDRITPWLGTVALDSAAYDVEKVMRSESPPRFYKKAFGRKSQYWREASPIHVLSTQRPPFLAVCSSVREDDSCLQAKSFVEKAIGLGTDATLLPVALSHRGVNVKLGKEYCYTQGVDAFMKTLHPDVELILATQSASRLRLKRQKNCADD